MAKCCIKKCNKHYCIECIIEHFNKVKHFLFRNLPWICIGKILGFASVANKHAIVRNVKIIS